MAARGKAGSIEWLGPFQKVYFKFIFFDGGCDLRGRVGQ